MPVAQSCNSLKITTSNISGNAITLTEDHGELHVNGDHILLADDYFNIKTLADTTYNQEYDFTHFHYTAESNITVNLLHPTGSKYITHHKKLSNAGNVTLTPPNGVTIDGSATKVINTQHNTISIYNDGSNFFIQ